MAQQAIYPGIEKELGGKAYVIPPLSLGQVRRLQNQLEKWTGAVDDKSVAVCIETVHAALSRNYPDVTVEQVEEWLDLGNMVELMQAVMYVSGMLRKAEEEKKAQAGMSTGTSSSAT